MPQNTRDALYQNLPPSLKLSLRSKLQSFRVKDEVSIFADIFNILDSFFCFSLSAVNHTLSHINGNFVLSS